MKPFITISDYRLYMTPLAFAVAGAASLFILRLTDRKTPISVHIYRLLCIGVCAMVGGRLVYLLLNRGQCLIRLDTIASYGGGISGQGSLLGGMLGLFVFSRDMRKPFLIEADALVFILPVFYMILRLRCYMLGCCWGAESERLLWGVVYPPSGFHKSFHVLHPVQLYESFANFLILLFLIEYRKSAKSRFPGQLFLVFLLLNSLGRFITDYFRWGASAKVVWGIATQAQLASALIILCSALAWFALSKCPGRQAVSVSV